MTTQFTCTGNDGTFITYSTADANGQYNVPFTLIPNTAANLNVYLWNTNTSEYDLVQENDATNPWEYDPANNRVDFDGSGPAVGTATLPDGSTQGTLMLARVTDVSEDELAQFTPGSSIRSQDLNDNFNKLGNAIQEIHCDATLNGEDFEAFYWNKVGESEGGNTIGTGDTFQDDNQHILTAAAADDRYLGSGGAATNITAGDGIRIDAPAEINVDLATNSGLEFDSGDLAVDANNGLTRDANGLNVGAGNGITVGADAVNVNAGDGLISDGTNVRVDLADPSGLEFDGGDLRVDANAGLTINTDGLNVGAGNGITVNADDVTINLNATNPGLAVDADGLRTNGNQTGIGTVQFGTGDTYTFPTSDGSANEVLTTDGTGGLSWTDKTADTNTTYDLTVPDSTTDIRLAGSDGTNDDITITGGTNVTVTRTSATELDIAATDTNTTYTLPVTEDSGNAVLTLTGANPASTDAVTITAGNNVTFGSFSAGGFTINASGGGSGTSGITIEDEGTALTTDATTLDFVGAGVTASGTGSSKTITIPGTNTTYDLTVPDSTTDIRLAASDGTNDDVTITGGTNITVTRTSATELNIAGDVAAANDGQINVSAGNGLTASGDNATANQSGNTTRTLAVGAGTGITVNTDDVQLAEIANNRVLGNSSGADAAPTAVQVATDMIANDAVTYAKMQDVATANRVLGSTTASGAVSEVQVALGMINATGGAANRVLTINGTNDGLAWTAPAGGFDFPSGTRMLFQQTAAPTGFTKDTAAGVNNRALRLVNGTVGSGGTVDFTTAFSDKSGSLSGATVGDATLTTSQIPSHTHPMNMRTASGGTPGTCVQGAFAKENTTYNTNTTGGNGSHTHSITGGSVDFDLDVEYTDVIVAARD